MTENILILLNSINSIYLFFLVAFILVLSKNFSEIINISILFAFLIPLLLILKKMFDLNPSLSAALIACFWIYISVRVRKYYVYIITILIIGINFFLKLTLGYHSFLELSIGTMVGFLVLFIYIRYVEGVLFKNGKKEC